MKYCFLVGILLFTPTFLYAKGPMIAVVGISGSGKSTTLKALHKLIPHAQMFAEPDANQWPETINQKALVGQFTYITSFRNIWDMTIKKAQKSQAEGNIVLIDHYYGKVWHQIIGRPDSEWIIDPASPYFPVMKQLAILDAQMFPDPDVLLLFEIDYKTYRSFLKKRSRWLDKNRPYKSIFKTQTYIKEAADELAKRGVKVIVVKQGQYTPEIQAKKIYDELCVFLPQC